MSGSVDAGGAYPPFDWSTIRLVVFDVDGTLYRQAPLRVRMAAKLLWHAATRFDMSTLAVLSDYRRLREELGHGECADFETVLLERTGSRHGLTNGEVRAIVERWIHREPLPYLRVCARPGIERLFAGIRRSGRTVGVFSDYPAEEKLSALGLRADRIVVASDVGRLKPHPRGLEKLIADTGVTPPQTVLIGDRVELDGLAANRAGAKALILSAQPVEGWRTFACYRDPIFRAFLA